MLEEKTQLLVTMFTQNFNTRILTLVRLHQFATALDIERTEHSLLFKMKYNDQQHVLEVPVPFIRNGVTLVSKNYVERPVPQYYLKAQDKLIDYMGVVNEILFGNPSHLLPEHMIKSGSTGVQQLKFAFAKGTVALAVNNMQKCIDYLINMMPLHETDYNSLVINHRITLCDPEFDVLTDPEEQLEYQVAKNREFFDRNWSSLGLSDGSLADKNYMLSCDLRKLSPFGSNFHNPQRNLYSTLGMKGDETPLLHSETTKRLADMGLSRKGWNLFTVFVDIPDVWEDQLMVDISHQDKCVEYDKRYICFGDLTVTVNTELTAGDALCVHTNGDEKLFDLECDSAYVYDIEEKLTIVGGTLHKSHVVTVKYKRYLKDGTKLTNMAANKGIIRMCDLGYAVNPVTGENQKIDLIVSAKAVLKRKNYTQILEAIYNTLNGNQPSVVPDAVTTTDAQIKQALVAAGHNEEGTWECNTYAGKFNCIAGTVFWGVTHDADDTTWSDRTVKRENARGLRTSGLKFSTIEFRAISTRFGKNNPLEAEILSHAQGNDDLREMMNILRHKSGKPYMLDAIDVKNLVPLNNEGGMMYSEQQLVGSIADPNLHEGAFMLQLPIEYQVVLDADYKVLSEGFPADPGDCIDGVDVHKIIKFKEIYVPEASLRQSWKHDVGKFGLGDITTVLSNIVTICHRFMDVNTHNSIDTTLLYRTIFSYYSLIAKKLTSKRGEISVRGMSVRYPHSAKGVAALSNELPPNTIQIHKEMAAPLNLKTNDVVLVERFPCLGFMSLRPQKVEVTDDPLCRYTIRASGNSLGSLSLDFDGDVLYIAAFKTPEAIKALHDEWNNPNEHCWEQIQKFNEKMGTPRTMELALSDYQIEAFELLTPESHAEIVRKLTGVKSNTGPVVALAYNLLRIMENSRHSSDQRLEVLIEVFMDTVANSVFKQKHGKESLHQVVKDAISAADEATLVANGFNEEIAGIVCEEIRAKAKALGVDNVADYAAKLKMMGNSGSIVNKIIKAQNKTYYVSRSVQEGCRLVKLLMEAKPVDVPSRIFRKIMESPTKLQKSDALALSLLKDPENRDYCEKIFKEINAIMCGSKIAHINMR